MKGGLESEVADRSNLQDSVAVDFVDAADAVGYSESALGDSLSLVTVEPVRAEDVLGFYTTLEKPTAESGQWSGVGRSLTTTPIFVGVELLVFLSYCIIVFRYCSMIGSLFGLVGGRREAMKLIGDKGVFFDRYLVVLVTLGFLTLSLVVVKIIEVYFAEQLLGIVSPEWSEMVVYALPLVVFVALYGLWLAKNAMLKVAHGLLPNKTLIVKLLRSRKLVFSLTTFFFVIPALLLINADNVGFFALSGLLIIIALLALFLYLSRTILVFFEEKSSIFYWFLYLCIVEVFPTSFLIFFVIKSI